ncbi:unnamed protein product (macronuclear) [Paramecium tetraurelia]|uniref:HSF-type DNA-binding domain-containing protein n=1 Tax=Paramecium tetraurelia TaxID=5888 RepID=A0C210_PARTE|nr:uncharacterized protein GSPATT00034304001 [Paramecium tetraurelia]CAK64827.1 unnamed protein product [Paramecium tetraurelia]|eukprot:XP_001432224.1 hypothetical protein (macronuclear) [Paramecium tetraurelia strain d4-2]
MDRAKEEHNIKQKASTPSFLIKTYDILEVNKLCLHINQNPDYNEIISWNEEGTAFVVKNVNELAEKVLPNHFKHNNYASFVRQLNMYDFHKMKNEGGDNEFRHKYFQRGNKQSLIPMSKRHLLCEIKRKQGEQVEQFDERNQNSSQNSNNSMEVDMSKLKNDYQFFLNEMLGIKGKQHELQKALILIMTQNDHLINENKLLWQEIKRIRETDERKIDTLSYLLATLITNMNQSQNQQTVQQLVGVQVPPQTPIPPQEPNNHIDQQFNNLLNLQQLNQNKPGQQKDQKQLQEHNSFLEKIMKTQQQQEQQLQSIKQDISQYDNGFMKKQCNNQFQRQPQHMDSNFMVQQNSQALIQQLMSLSQQQQSQQQQQQGQQFQNNFQNYFGQNKGNENFRGFPFL